MPRTCTGGINILEEKWAHVFQVGLYPNNPIEARMRVPKSNMFRTSQKNLFVMILTVFFSDLEIIPLNTSITSSSAGSWKRQRFR